MMQPNSVPWRALAITLAVGFTGCSVDGWRSGTGVGNPGSAKTVLSRVAGVTLSEADATVNALVAERCDGTVVRTDVNRTVDLAVGAFLELGGGSLCAVELQLEPPLAVRGTVDAGDTLSLDIPLETVRVAAGSTLRVDGEGYVFELGNGTWFDPNTPEDVGSIAATIEATSALYLDDDDDGEVDDEERDAGPVAEGESDGNEPSNDDPDGNSGDDDGNDGSDDGDEAESNEADGNDDATTGEGSNDDTGAP